MVIIYYKMNYFTYKNALKKANEYWNSLNYDKTSKSTHKKNKPSDGVLYCDGYGIFINRYSIDLMNHDGALTGKEAKEIKTILECFFYGKNKGFVNKFGSSVDQSVIDVIKSVSNIIKSTSTISCEWSDEAISKCKKYVGGLDVTDDNKDVIDTLNQILGSLSKNI